MTRTKSAPAAVSQLFRSASKYAVTLPQATQANIMAALPSMRIVRTGKLANALYEGKINCQYISSSQVIRGFVADTLSYLSSR